MEEVTCQNWLACCTLQSTDCSRFNVNVAFPSVSRVMFAKFVKKGRTRSRVDQNSFV
jgi:hypothetical protein